MPGYLSHAGWGTVPFQLDRGGLLFLNSPTRIGLRCVSIITVLVIYFKEELFGGLGSIGARSGGLSGPRCGGSPGGPNRG